MVADDSLSIPTDRLSPSVRSALKEWTGSDSVSSLDIVQAILRLHKEYGGSGASRPVLERDGLSDGPARPVAEWVRSVIDWEGPALQRDLDGRRMISGLAAVDPALRDFLSECGFLEALARERFTFVLNNEAKRTSSLGTPREQGFVTLVHGQRDLVPLEAACRAQSYNRCFVARYHVGDRPVLPALLHAWLHDIAELLGSGPDEPAGESISRPDEPTRRPRGHLGTAGPIDWSELRDTPLHEVARTWQEEGSRPVEPGWIQKDLVRAIAETLDMGQRLVLLAEPAGDDPVDLSAVGLVDAGGEPLDFPELPERLCIVISHVDDDAIPPPGAPDTLRLVSAQETPAPIPVAYGQAFHNDEPRGPDRLQIRDEVHALVETLALKDMEPPLVVGVLGGWGWGKSFVLHLMQERLEDIRAFDLTDDEDRKRFPYIGHPYVIRFDAWTYAKSDLWASLIRTILGELDRQIDLERRIEGLDGLDLRQGGRVWKALAAMPEARRKALLSSELGGKVVEEFLKRKEATGEEYLWSRFEKSRKRERELLDKAEKDLAAKKQKREEARKQLEAKAEKRVEKRRQAELTRSALKPLMNQLGNSFKERLEEETGDAAPSWDDVRNTIGLKDRIKAGRSRLTLFLGLSAIASLMVWLLAEGDGILATVFESLGQFGAVTSTVVAVVAGAMKYVIWLDEQREAWGAEDERIREKEAEWKEEAVAEILRKSDMAADAEGEDAEPDEPSDPEVRVGRELTRLDKDVEVLRLNVEERRRRVGMTAQHRSLQDFLRSRLQGQYDERLGIMHEVQDDLRELTEALIAADEQVAVDETSDEGDAEGPADDEAAETTDAEQTKLFPRGEPRVFLIIDDLDRCPPESVVEVLEAAQLLVKTRLFVLVLAMDVRFITRALEEKYRRVLVRDGVPSGLDYLEKIVQIPYRVRPIQPGAMLAFLKSQMQMEATRPGPGESDGAPPPTDDDVGSDTASREDDGSGEQTSSDDGDPTGERAPEAGSSDDGETTRTGGTPPEKAAEPATTEGLKQDPLPTTIRKFSEGEPELLSDCCNAAVLSPRSVKRMVNVFKLLKIVWDRRADASPSEDVKRAMLMLLALSARHPEVLRSLLRRLENAFRGGDPAPSAGVAEFLLKCCSQVPGDDSRHAEWTDVEALLGAGEVFPQALTLTELGLHNVHLVSTFSFLGDSDPEVEDRTLIPGKP